MEFQHAMFTRNGVRNLKEIKRGNQSKKAEAEEGGGEDDMEAEMLPAAKRQRQDYASFRTDMAHLQKSLVDFEQDLKEHTMQVREKRACLQPRLASARG